LNYRNGHVLTIFATQDNLTMSPSYYLRTRDPNVFTNRNRDKHKRDRLEAARFSFAPKMKHYFRDSGDHSLAEEFSGDIDLGVGRLVGVPACCLLPLLPTFPPLAPAVPLQFGPQPSKGEESLGLREPKLSDAVWMMYSISADDERLGNGSRCSSSRCERV